MRLFVGLPLPEAYQEGLGRLVPVLRPLAPGRLSWTRPGEWHLTLKFLGQVPGEALDDLRAALAGVSWQGFDFRAGAAGFFPSPARPRVFWLGAAEGGRACAGLAGAIDSALEPLGFAPVTRPFSPHLTLARIHSARPGADWGALAREALGSAWPRVRMERFVLWRSFLGGCGEGREGNLPGDRQAGCGPDASPQGRVPGAEFAEAGAGAGESGAPGREKTAQPGPRHLPLGEFGASG